MAKSDTPAKATPQFGGVAPPPARSREGALSLDREQAETLVQAIEDGEGWASDGLSYSDAKAAYSAANGYRRALQTHGLIPDGLTLGSRAQNVEGEGVILYLRWREPRRNNSAS